MCIVKAVQQTMNSSVLFCSFSRPRSEGWPHHGRTFSICPCPLSMNSNLRQKQCSAGDENRTSSGAQMKWKLLRCLETVRAGKCLLSTECRPTSSLCNRSVQLPKRLQKRQKMAKVRKTMNEVVKHFYHIFSRRLMYRCFSVLFHPHERCYNSKFIPETKNRCSE